jgi:hypothetical protein
LRGNSELILSADYADFYFAGGFYKDAAPTVLGIQNAGAN